jgi:hypothetical protein
MDLTRREFVANMGALAIGAALPLGRALAQSASGANDRDRVLLCTRIPTRCR